MRFHSNIMILTVSLKRNIKRDEKVKKKEMEEDNLKNSQNTTLFSYFAKSCKCYRRAFHYVYSIMSTSASENRGNVQRVLDVFSEQNCSTSVFRTGESHDDNQRSCLKYNSCVCLDNKPKKERRKA